MAQEFSIGVIALPLFLMAWCLSAQTETKSKEALRASGWVLGLRAAVIEPAVAANPKARSQTCGSLECGFRRRLDSPSVSGLKD